MKLFDLDWQDFIDRLAAWQRLSLEARRTLAELRPNQELPLRASGGPERLLAENGFAEICQRGQRVRLAKSFYSFGRAIRAMVRHDLIACSDTDAMLNYLRDHFTGEELSARVANRRYGHWSDRYLTPEIMSVGWVEAFLARDTVPTHTRRQEHDELPRWLKLHRPEQEPIVDSGAARQLVRHLMELPGPVAFAELSGRWPDLPTAALGTAILIGIEQLVLFPMMRRTDMTPMLGLWPTVSRRLHRPTPKPPKPVNPQTIFCGAFRVEDMTTILVAAAAQPLRLRSSDGALFAKADREIEVNLMSIPSWIVRYLSSERIKVAMQWLQICGLARCAGVPGDDLGFEATRLGEQWLAESAKGRLRAILDHLRSSARAPHVTAAPAYVYGDDLDDLDDLDDDDLDDDDLEDDDLEEYERCFRRLEFLPCALPGANIEKHGERLRTAVVSAISALPEERFVPLADFLEWQAAEANPLPALFSETNSPNVYIGWSQRRPTVEEMESLWSRYLMEMLCSRLLPLGCMRMGIIEGSDDVAIALASPGPYLLGAANDFDYGHDHDAQGQIVVQPNFEIVFFAPSPLAEASLARFAQRKSRGVGALFSITKKSILAAAGSGMMAAQVLETLTRLSAKPLPANVAREIAGWFDQCRRISVHSAVLIHCPDADTAARVVGAGGKKALLLTDTIVELTDSRAKTELLRKLHGLGIFTESLTHVEHRRVKTS
jgi:hypothetical protein